MKCKCSYKLSIIDLLSNFFCVASGSFNSVGADNPSHDVCDNARNVGNSKMRQAGEELLGCGNSGDDDD